MKKALFIVLIILIAGIGFLTINRSYNSNNISQNWIEVNNDTCRFSIKHPSDWQGNIDEMKKDYTSCYAALSGQNKLHISIWAVPLKYINMGPMGKAKRSLTERKSIGNYVGYYEKKNTSNGNEENIYIEHGEWAYTISYYEPNAADKAVFEKILNTIQLSP